MSTNYRYLQAIKVIKEMMTQRGFNISSENDDFLIYQNNKKYVWVYKNIFLKLCSITYNKKILNVYKNDNKINHFLLIYDVYETCSLKRLIRQNIDFVYVETFNVNSVQYNITKHFLVPQHKKVPKEEYKLFTFNTSKLPKLLSSEPICRFYNFKKNDIISIKRNDCITYRIVS